ncbi:choice-of-anchor tandem repeat GloVer-containing protein [Nostoc sp.]|uniref:choice-of-anchor tandem repeat GloVer-containing protein n=1 Tax=Nostoc sp. TaxID=1180 RepID=UPI002FF94E40
MNKTNLYKQRQNKNRVSILTSLAVLASPLVLPLHQAVAASLTTVANFNGANGAVPRAGVFQGKDLNLYGTTSAGGSSNNGKSAFKLSGAGFSTLTTLINFTGTALPNRGTNPIARLFQATKAALTPGASSGIFYGTASTGGANNRGVVYQLNIGDKPTITQLISFNTTNGATPESTLIPVGTDYYGTASAGGASGKGTVFKFTP